VVRPAEPGGSPSVPPLSPSPRSSFASPAPIGALIAADPFARPRGWREQPDPLSVALGGRGCPGPVLTPRDFPTHNQFVTPFRVQGGGRGGSRSRPAYKHAHTVASTSQSVPECWSGTTWLGSTRSE